MFRTRVSDLVSQFEELTLGCLSRNGAWLRTFDVSMCLMSSVNIRDYLHFNCSPGTKSIVFSAHLHFLDLLDWDQYLQICSIFNKYVSNQGRTIHTSTNFRTRSTILTIGPPLAFQKLRIFMWWFSISGNMEHVIHRGLDEKLQNARFWIFVQNKGLQHRGAKAASEVASKYIFDISRQRVGVLRTFTKHLNMETNSSKNRYWGN